MRQLDRDNAWKEINIDGLSNKLDPVLLIVGTITSRAAIVNHRQTISIMKFRAISFRLTCNCLFGRGRSIGIPSKISIVSRCEEYRSVGRIRQVKKARTQWMIRCTGGCHCLEISFYFGRIIVRTMTLSSSSDVW